MAANWVAASVGLLLVALGAYRWKQWVTTAPLDEPVVLAQPVKLVRSISVRASDRYFLELFFDRRDASFEALRSLVGGVHGQRIEVDGRLIDANEPPGLLIPLVWSLRDEESGRVVAGGTADALGSNSWSAQEVGRVLYQGDVEAGRYTFSAELAAGIPAFERLRSHLKLSLSPMHSYSVAMRTYWLSAAVLPLAALGFVVTAAVAVWKKWG